jgi:glycosyltransferase involved in cell wall biosynthesis
MDLFIIIPARNEEKHIATVINNTKPYCQNIIVVDDGSTDQTSTVAKQTGALTVTHKVNLGKGAAMKTGCEYAIQQGATHLIVMDADGQHEPKEIPHFQKALETNDIVFGTRNMPKSMPFVMRFGNKFINKTLNFFHNVNIEDSQCGYRAFTAQAYQKIRWDALDYFVETEMTIRAGKQKLKYIQHPIQTIYNDNYKGTTILDGINIVTKMISSKILK